MAEESSFQSIFGQTPGQLGVGAAGTFAGGALNYFFNSQLQERQFKEQEKLQKRAVEMNEQSVARQAPNQVLGMQNAGLNPASVNGAGAPSVQAGAAAGSTSQLANIFSGVAEIVAAAKAPSEVTKNISEAGKADAEADKANQESVESATRTVTLIPAQVEKLKADAVKVAEDARTSRNFNDAWEGEDKMLRQQTKTVFSSVREQMQNSKRWNKLPQDVRIALDNLAEGNISVGKGEYEAIMKELKLRGEFSDADLKLMDNALKYYVSYKQLHDKDVRKALVDLPKNQQEELMANIKHLQALRAEIYQGKIPLDKAQAALAGMQTKLVEVERKIKELNDPLYLADEGRERELSNYTTRESLQNLYDFLKEGIKFLELLGVSELNARRTGKETADEIKKPKKLDSPPSKRKVFEKTSDLAPDDNPIFKSKKW